MIRLLSRVNIDSHLGPDLVWPLVLMAMHGTFVAPLILAEAGGCPGHQSLSAFLCGNTGEEHSSTLYSSQLALGNY